MKIISSAFLLFIFSCISISYAKSPVKSPSIRVEKAWLKAPIPGMKMTAAYMTLINEGEKDITLVEIKGDDAEYYEIHTVSMKDGRMRMRQLKEIVIKAHSSHQLRPGADHIMVIQIKKNRLTKPKTSLTLFFKDGLTKTIQLPISKSLDKI